MTIEAHIHYAGSSVINSSHKVQTFNSVVKDHFYLRKTQYYYTYYFLHTFFAALYFGCFIVSSIIHGHPFIALGKVQQWDSMFGVGCTRPVL